MDRQRTSASQRTREDTIHHAYDACRVGLVSVEKGAVLDHNFHADNDMVYEDVPALLWTVGAAQSVVRANKQVNVYLYLFAPVITVHATPCGHKSRKIDVSVTLSRKGNVTNLCLMK